MGLSIAQDIAHAHGGDLSLNNTLAGGLEAVLILPGVDDRLGGCPIIRLWNEKSLTVFWRNLKNPEAKFKTDQNFYSFDVTRS